MQMPSCSALAPRALRPSPRHWKLIAAAVALVAAGYAAMHVPLVARIQIQHELKSFGTRAPVMILGDSIAYASSPQTLCGEEVFNAAVPGAGVADLLGQGVRLADRVQPRRVVVAIGVNDAARSRADLQKWAAEYRQLVMSLSSEDLTLVEVNPLDSSFPAMTRLFDTDFIAQQNAIIRTLAAETGAHLVRAPLTSETADGLHPNAGGTVLWRARLSQSACAR